MRGEQIFFSEYFVTTIKYLLKLLFEFIGFYTCVSKELFEASLIISPKE